MFCFVYFGGEGGKGLFLQGEVVVEDVDSSVSSAGFCGAPKNLLRRRVLNCLAGLTTYFSMVGAISAAPAILSGRDMLLIPYMIARMAGRELLDSNSPVDDV